MKAKKLYYMECNVAGRQYHDADEVWDELKVGTKLCLVRDMDNRFDKNAIAIVYHKTVELDNAQMDDEYILGYIPRNQNETMAALLEMGWNNIFECRISKIDAETHYEDQLHVSIRIIKNEQPHQ